MKSVADDRKMKRDLKTLARFVELYCRHHHADQPRGRVQVKGVEVAKVAGREPSVCADCARLLSHGIFKRMNCPMDPKPACKHCACHCYHTSYRERIREVMRFSGMRILLRGRLDYLFHLLF